METAKFLVVPPERVRGLYAYNKARGNKGLRLKNKVILRYDVWNAPLGPSNGVICTNNVLTSTISIIHIAKQDQLTGKRSFFSKTRVWWSCLHRRFIIFWRVFIERHSRRGVSFIWLALVILRGSTGSLGLSLSVLTSEEKCWRRLEFAFSHFSYINRGSNRNSTFCSTTPRSTPFAASSTGLDHHPGNEDRYPFGSSTVEAASGASKVILYHFTYLPWSEPP